MPTLCTSRGVIIINIVFIIIITIIIIIIDQNTYSVFAGLTMDSEAEFLRIDEISDDWSRCCCKPYHSVKLEVRAAIPLPGEGQHSDWQHLWADSANSWDSLSTNDRAKAMIIIIFIVIIIIIVIIIVGSQRRL